MQCLISPSAHLAMVRARGTLILEHTGKHMVPRRSRWRGWARKEQRDLSASQRGCPRQVWTPRDHKVQYEVLAHRRGEAQRRKQGWGRTLRPLVNVNTEEKGGRGSQQWGVSLWEPWNKPSSLLLWETPGLVLNPFLSYLFNQPTLNTQASIASLSSEHEQLFLSPGNCILMRISEI